MLKGIKNPLKVLPIYLLNSFQAQEQYIEQSIVLIQIRCLYYGTLIMNGQRANLSIIYRDDKSYSSGFIVIGIILFWFILIAITTTVLVYSASSCSCNTTGTYFDIWRLACRSCI